MFSKRSKAQEVETALALRISALSLLSKIVEFKQDGDDEKIHKKIIEEYFDKATTKASVTAFQTYVDSVLKMRLDQVEQMDKKKQAENAKKLITWEHFKDKLNEEKSSLAKPSKKVKKITSSLIDMDGCALHATQKRKANWLIDSNEPLLNHIFSQNKSRHSDMSIPKNVTLRLYEYAAKDVTQSHDLIQGTADKADTNYEWSVRFQTAKAYYWSGAEEREYQENITNAEKLEQCYKDRPYFKKWDCGMNLCHFDVDLFTKMRDQEIPKLAEKSTLGKDPNYLTAGALFNSISTAMSTATLEVSASPSA
ncbi:MAG: hypothetical protein ABI597_03110 [Gammaproteobacteria bacterium]